MRIEHKAMGGVDHVEFHYYAEAEPKLYEIKKQVEFGSLTEAEAHEAILALVGPHRFNTEWAAIMAANPCPPDRSRQLWELERFEEAHTPDDPRRRLYGVAAAENIEVLLGFKSVDTLERGPRQYI